MTYIIIVLVMGILTCLYLLKKPVLRLIAEKRAISKIEDILFSKTGQTKSTVLAAIHELTSQRLSDEMVMDYFYKIKGLQVLNINKPMNFWVKIYLTTPTKVKLNYFEQVKFYETFLNYPKIDGNSSEARYDNQNRAKVSSFRTNLKNQIAEKLIPQKLA